MAKVKPGTAKPGCFSDFFQQLLCAGNANSPPLLHPCDHHITESHSHATELVHPINKDGNEMVNCNAVKPGVVARLMGLDSLPNSTNLLASKGSTNPDLVPRRRSRSVNFVDYLLKFDDNHQVKKTSASFREVPAMFQHEKHDLLVLYYSGSEDHHQVGSNLRKQEMGLGEWRQRKKQGRKNKEVVRARSSTVTKERNSEKNKKISKFKNEAIVVPAVKHGSKVRNHIEAKVLASVSACSRNCGTRKGGTGSRSNFVNQNKQKKKVFYEPKHTKNVREQQPRKKMETECSSENFSPVSVLDYPYLYGPDFLGLFSEFPCSLTCLLIIKIEWYLE